MAIAHMAAPDPMLDALAVVGQSLAALLNRVAGLEALARTQDARLAEIEKLVGIRLASMAKP